VPFANSASAFHFSASVRIEVRGILAWFWFPTL